MSKIFKSIFNLKNLENTVIGSEDRGLNEEVWIGEDFPKFS